MASVTSCGEIKHMQYGTGNVVRTVQVRTYMKTVSQEKEEMN